MSEIKNVVIIGAAGNLGPAILDAFLQKSSFNVTVLTREESKSTFPSGVKVVRADYSSIDSLKEAFQGQDAVVSLVGGNALGDQQKLIDAAIAAGVKRFLPSEFGSNTEDEFVAAAVPVFKFKIATVDYLKSNEDKISWSTIITGPFFDWGLKIGFTGFNLANKKASLIDEGKGHWIGTNLAQIGLATVKVLEKAAETKNKHIYISSFTTTQNDVLAALEKFTGSKFTVENTSSKEHAARGAELVSRGDYSGIMLQIQATALGDHGHGDYSSAGLWNEKLGLPKEDFEATIKGVLEG
ncbi:NAD(P)-binding protein [Polyplosphaeria fusca]|uniref:NAD(P)-binding protein n=1 Tax=Polyplosphaeria fusca TaxID=682080 RepID=A0A9P4R8X0_9PLEO|nr:NAD(P)-binding protein [Polyplosphaeria fusca]